MVSYLNGLYNNKHSPSEILINKVNEQIALAAGLPKSAVYTQGSVLKSAKDKYIIEYPTPPGSVTTEQRKDIYIKEIAPKVLQAIGRPDLIQYLILDEPYFANLPNPGTLEEQTKNETNNVINDPAADTARMRTYIIIGGSVALLITAIIIFRKKND